MTRRQMTRPLAAEFLGTFLLLATVVGSGIMAERLSGGNIAIALLANALATGAMLVVLITIFAPLSGAHFNPSVTLYFALRGEIGFGPALFYMLTQCVAAVAGVWLAHAMFTLPILQISTHLRDGPAQWLAEFIATFGLILTIAGGIRFAPTAIPMLVGLYITGAYWFTASTSFANPAVTLARALTQTFAGIAPQSAPGFIAAQLLAATASAFVLPWLFTAKA
jgi:glycerol uptake facilitator-like aquaporin